MNLIQEYLWTAAFAIFFGMLALFPVALFLWLINTIFGVPSDSTLEDPTLLLFLWVLGTGAVGALLAVIYSRKVSGLKKQVETAVGNIHREQENIKHLEYEKVNHRRETAIRHRELESEVEASKYAAHREHQRGLRQKLSLALEIADLTSEIEDERQWRREQANEIAALTSEVRHERLRRQFLEDEIQKRDAQDDN